MIVFFTIYYFSGQKHFSINNHKEINKLELIAKQFPIEAINDFYQLKCSFEGIELHSNYNSAPMLPGGWKSIADIKCVYLNTKNKKETIFLPLSVYNEEEKEFLLVGAQPQQKTKEEIVEIANLTTVVWYEKMIENFLFAKPEQGKTLKVLVNFPDWQFNSNQTNGAAFEVLTNSNPPYTKNSLEKFYENGDASFLPKINNISYFWPIAGYHF